MTEREISNEIREAEINRIKKFYEEGGFIVERILSQNSPSSLLIFLQDGDNLERYLEIKFIVKNVEYTPDEDVFAFREEIKKRAEKAFKAKLNKLNKKERQKEAAHETAAVKEYVDKFCG